MDHQLFFFSPKTTTVQLPFPSDFRNWDYQGGFSEATMNAFILMGILWQFGDVFLPWLMVSPPHSKVTKTSGWLKGRKIESITLLLLAPDFCISSSYCSAVKGSKISDIECGPITICHISSKHIPLHQLEGKGQQDTQPNLSKTSKRSLRAAHVCLSETLFESPFWVCRNS